MKSLILTADQARVAAALCNVLDGHPTGDGLEAIVSIAAATINDRAGGRDEALSDAYYYGRRLVETVEAGLRGELIRNDEKPIDPRLVS